MNMSRSSRGSARKGVVFGDYRVRAATAQHCQCPRHHQNEVGVGLDVEESAHSGANASFQSGRRRLVWPSPQFAAGSPQVAVFKVKHEPTHRNHRGTLTVDGPTSFTCRPIDYGTTSALATGAHTSFGLLSVFFRYERAALQGDAGACYIVASMYERGYGVGVDPERAVFWYLQAAVRGEAGAAELAQALIQKLDAI